MVSGGGGGEKFRENVWRSFVVLRPWRITGKSSSRAGIKSAKEASSKRSKTKVGRWNFPSWDATSPRAMESKCASRFICERRARNDPKLGRVARANASARKAVGPEPIVEGLKKSLGLLLLMLANRLVRLLRTRAA